MKKLSIITLGILISIGAFAQHDHGKKDHSKMKKEEAAVNYKAPADFTNQLNGAFKEALDLTKSFASDKSDEAKEQAGNVKSALEKVDMNLLKNSGAMMDWMMNLKDMNTALSSISASSNIAVQRSSFALFNLAMYKSLKSFGTGGDTVYYQHCPMADGNKGAYWFSATKDISNPYAGGMMKSCGSTKETL